MSSLQLFSLVLFAALQTTVSLDAGLPAYQLSSYTVPFDCELCDPKFNHFVIHNATGDVYLGASNTLVHLNSSYQEIKTESTFIECPDGVDREDCINHNKLLVIHYGSTEKLITCGNYNGGRCQIRETSNIEMYYESESSIDKVAAPGDLSTVYTIAPGRITGMVINEEMLYVGATDPDKTQVPVYSRRRLNDNRAEILSYPQYNDLDLITGSFTVNFKDAFDFNGFTYFVTNQLFDISASVDMHSDVISKVNRVCQDSSHLDSFADVVMECKDSTNGDNYNLIQAVHLTTVGSDSLNINPNEQILIGLFAQSVSPTEFTAANRSALCIFNLDDVEMKFLQALVACLDSSDDEHGLSYITQRSCTTVSMKLISHF